MTGTLMLHSLGPSVSLQDMGRPGFLAKGLTRGGAADTLALIEASVLLDQAPNLAALEMVGMGGTFEVDTATTIALTGAKMDARIDGVAIAWNASHTLPARAKLTIGGTRDGTYGYLAFAGGIDAPLQMNARGRHINARIGHDICAGEALPLGSPSTSRSGWSLPRDDRFSGGAVRIVPSMQTENFAPAMRERFGQTTFHRDARANRMGARMDHSGEGFFATDTLSIVSEVIIPGDIQITGDGAPFVLLCECQTTGGYPRIGAVIPSDLPKVAQAPAGAEIRFEFITTQAAIDIERQDRQRRSSLAQSLTRLIRDPYEIADLLAYQLVSGAVSATADPFNS